MGISVVVVADTGPGSFGRHVRSTTLRGSIQETWRRAAAN